MKIKKINNKYLLIVIILTFGVLYKLLITSNGNFLFNMDNARDMVDVREIVVLHKLRLTGPTSGIEGFYNGPAWYYLLAIPFILSNGNPYASVLLMIALWVIGGFFLLKISSRWGSFIMTLLGILWISSNYVTLSTVYAFNPNPVILLTPLLIYLLENYLSEGTLTLSALVWLLSGLFFNFEMAFGLFMPLIIFSATILSRKFRLFETKAYWAGFGVFILTLLPQLIFNLRHDSILLNSVFRQLKTSSLKGGFNLPSKIKSTMDLYNSVLGATLLNWQLLKVILLILFVLVAILAYKKQRPYLDNLTAVLLSFIFVPFLGSMILPLNFMPWHLGGSMAAVLLLIGGIAFFLKNNGKVIRYGVYLGGLVVLFYALNNLEILHNLDPNKVNNDPSSFKNEIAAIDSVYNLTAGKDFRVYVYMPSVIDYPYQYLFWWYGHKKYNFIPMDYAYLPNKPQYISNVAAFAGDKTRDDSGLTALIIDPNREDLRDLWLNNFRKMQLLKTEKVGPFEIQLRK